MIQRGRGPVEPRRDHSKSRDLQATAVEIPWSGTVTVDMTEELSDPSGSCLRTYSATLTFSGSDSAQISGAEAYQCVFIDARICIVTTPLGSIAVPVDETEVGRDFRG